MRSALATLPAAYQVGYDLARDEVYVGYDARAGLATVVAPDEPAPDVVVLPAID